MASKLLPSMRVSYCYKRLSEGSKRVEVRYNEQAKRAYYSGLMTCGSVWVCPVCSAKITEARRVELTRAVETWREGGGSLVMVTLTLQHHQGDELKSLLTALKDSWRRLKAGRAWISIRERYGLAAYVSSTELTWGDNGWHPHIHALFFSDLPEGEFDVESFEAELTARYTALLAKHGRYGSKYYALDVRLGDEYAGSYASKYGLEHELTKSISKNGRGGCSPFQLLERYGEGDERAGQLFQEYAAVFFGSKQLTWSHKARERLGLGDDLPDEEIAAAEEPESITLAELTPSDYRKIVDADLRGEVLEIASRGDAAYLWSYLALAVGLKIPEDLFITGGR